MRDGSDRSNVPHVRPSTLLRPKRPPKLVYLDLNHWIGLSKARAWRTGGDLFRSAWEACLAARREGRATFPISDAIYFEVSKNPRHGQRQRLREAIEELSEYATIVARYVIARHEVEAMLDRAVGPSAQPIESIDYIGWGVVSAFGRGTGRLRVKRKQDGVDVTEQFRASYRDGPHAFDEYCRTAELRLQRSILDGPEPGEEELMREYGWDPDAAIDTARRRAQQEVEQVARFDADPRWRKGRIRDVVSARELLIEINEMLARGLAARGDPEGRVFESVERARKLSDSMPSFDVAVSIKAEYHRDPHHRWTANDILDIDALGSSLPYCDVVVTDKAVASNVERCGLADRLGTVVLSRLDDLLPYIA